MTAKVLFVEFVTALASVAGCAQAVPAASTGGAMLHYGLAYSETAQWSSYLGNWHTIDGSGFLDYSNGSPDHRAHLSYTGGYTYTLAGPSYGKGVFQRLLIAHDDSWNKWHCSVADEVSYSPQAPMTGLSGVAGESISSLAPPAPQDQLIFTIKTHELINATSLGAQHPLNRFAAIDFDGDYAIMRFPDSNGLNTDSWEAGTGLTFRLSARNLASARYTFTRFDYSDYGFSTDAHTSMFGYVRSWSRRFSTSISAGPEWIDNSSPLGSRHSFALGARAEADYTGRSIRATAAYDRGISAGSGYFMGAQMNDVSGIVSKQAIRTLGVEMIGGYRWTSDFASSQVISGAFGGVRAFKAIGRYMNAFATYTATSQSSTSPVPSNVLRQTIHSLGVGISFSKGLRPAQ